MATWLLVWLVVGLVTTAVLVAFAVWMVRHVMLLWRTVARVQEELAPITEDLSRASARVGDRAAGLRPPSSSERSSTRR